MNTSELIAYVGRIGTVPLHGLTIAVTILDSKVAYGGVLVLVTPQDAASSGQKWVELRKVQLEERP